MMSSRNAESTQKVTITGRIHFRMMSIVHETFYGLVRDPYKALTAAGLKPGQRVLEVGCGPGFFTIPAAKMVGESGSICALDISPVAVKHVKQKIVAEGVTNVKVIVADAAKTGLPDQNFDLSFVFGLAHPIGNMGKIWAELHRLLKPGGILSVEGRLLPPSKFFHLPDRQGRIIRFRRIG